MKINLPALPNAPRSHAGHLNKCRPDLCSTLLCGQGSRLEVQLSSVRCTMDVLCLYYREARRAPRASDRMTLAYRAAYPPL